MTIEENLLPGSFRGVGFWVPGESERGGRKVAVHEYPGSDNRFVQDLGKLQPSFSVKAVVHGFDVISQRQRLTAALGQGEGILVHPYLGRRLVSPVNFTATTSDTSLGEVVFDIEFVQTDAAFGLLANTGGIADVFAAAERARKALDSAATGRYSPLAIQQSIQRVGERVSETLRTVQTTFSNVVNPVQDSINEFTRQVGNIQSQVLSISRTPQRLFTSMRGVYDALLGVALTPSAIKAEWATMANFGSAPRFLPNGQFSRAVGSLRDAIPRTTKKRRDEDDNLRVLDQHTRVEALINSLEAEADSDFDTDVDLAFALARLQSDFDRIVQNQDDVIGSSNLGDEILTSENVITPSVVVSEAVAFSDGLAFDPALRAELEALRVAAFSVLSAAEKAPARVSEFSLGVTDAQLASYQLYGDLENLDALASLNGDQNLALIRLPIRGLLG